MNELDSIINDFVHCVFEACSLASGSFYFRLFTVFFLISSIFSVLIRFSNCSYDSISDCSETSTKSWHY